jgi:hypothetical protein
MKRVIFFSAVLSTALGSSACYGESAIDNVAPYTSADGGQDVEVSAPGEVAPARHWTEEPELPYFPEAWSIEPATHLNALYRVHFYGAEEGVAAGWNLDGEISPEDDDASCGHGDFVSPEGEEGIDNQMAMVWALAESLIGEAVVALLQDGINEGRMLLMLELSDVDDLVNDEDVTLTLYRSIEVPIVSVAGFLMPDQTFRTDPDFPTLTFEHAAIVDGHVKAGPFDLAFPIYAFNANFLVGLADGYVEFDIDAAGRFSGHLGGIMDIHDVMGHMLETNAAEEAELIYPLVEGLADINKTKDGCTHLSAALRFDGVTGFRITESEDAEAP